jgi:LEA14-like dessication related protein
MKNGFARSSKCFARAMLQAGLLGLSLVSCQALQQLASIQQPTLEADNVRLKNLSFEAADLVLGVNITNPNPVGVTLNGFDYDLQIEGASLFKGNQASSQTIAGGAKSRVEIPVTLLFKDAYNAVQALKNQDSAKYKIACGLMFNLPVLGQIRVPASQSGHLPMIRIPQIKLQSLKVKKMSLTRADLELALGVSNPNAFSFALKKLNYDFTVNGLSWATGTTPDNASVAGKAEKAIRIPISLSLLDMGQTVVQLLSGSKALDYKLTGNLNLGTSIPAFKQAALPLDLAGKVNLTK